MRYKRSLFPFLISLIWPIWIVIFIFLINNPQGVLKMKKTEIDSPGLWLVKFHGDEATSVIRIIRGRYGQEKDASLLKCDNPGMPRQGVIPFWVTKKHLEKVYRKIKDPLGIE